MIHMEKISLIEDVSIPFISGQCVIIQLLQERWVKVGFNPLYIGSMCNTYDGSEYLDLAALFQSPLYRVNV